jgi:D-glycero-alpha-D-manno-heptose-7-phosphate kinase
MIISRTPLRISIGGGGTDLPSYYSSSGGHVISAAIDKYLYIAINETFTNDYFLKYSQLERAETRAEIKHPIIREALTLLEIEPSLEIISMADIPAGTGLGSSGTFTVGLLKALYAHRKEHVPAQHLAELACHIEMDLLGEPVGKQDQFIAAFGGLTIGLAWDSVKLHPSVDPRPPFVHPGG